MRHQRSTLLVVGEGDCEYAFLQFLRRLYCSDRAGVQVTIRNAQGGGPDSIVNQVIRHIRLAAYDKQLALLDTDLVWSDRLIKTAKKNKIVMVGSTPCLEGLLLRILGQSAPEQSALCKKNLQAHLKADMTDWRHYEMHFDRVQLERARNVLNALDTVLRHFEGRA